MRGSSTRSDPRSRDTARPSGDPAAAPSEAATPAGPTVRAHLWPLVTVLSTILIDQVTKLWAIRELARIDPDTRTLRSILIIPGFFDLTYADNTGAAFSLFENHPLALTLISVVISSVIFWWYWHTPREHTGTRLALALVFGGAIGNLIDRLFRGAVVDFIHVYYRQYHWPTFNVADSAIFIGIGLLILWSYREQRTS